MISPPRAHGGDGWTTALSLGLDPSRVLDLSASLNPFAPSLAPLISRHINALGRYPDATAASESLAAAIGVAPDRLLLTNGGSEAISLVAGELGGTVVGEPEFSLHPRSGTGPLWRSDPQNPTGHLAGPTERADVWDEAFYPLATARWTSGRNGVIVGSLTKVFACPGLRLGYIIADDVARFARRQSAWSVGSLGLAVLPELLELADLVAWAKSIDASRTALADLLATFDLEAAPSQAPWLLVKSPGLRERLAPHGVVVRDCTNFGLPQYARIAVPDHDGLEQLANALEQSE